MGRHEMFLVYCVVTACAITLSGCATTSPLASQVTDSERKIVNEEIAVQKKTMDGKEEHLKEIARKILIAAGVDPKAFQFKVGGNISGINAYVDGKKNVYFSPAMMRFVRNDDELAAVISHEVAHVLKNHHAKKTLQGMASMAASVVVGAYAETKVPGSGGLTAQALDASMIAPFSKEMEKEADAVALPLMKKSGFDQNAMAVFFRRMAIEIPQSQEATFFSTHPSAPERFERLRILSQKD